MWIAFWNALKEAWQACLFPLVMMNVVTGLGPLFPEVCQETGESPVKSCKSKAERNMLV